MKFSTSSIDLQKALAGISGVVPTRSTLPILENLLFELTGNSLRMSATDLEVSMSIRMEVKGEKDGAIAVPARRLIETVRSLPDVPLTFNANPDDNKITLKTQSGTYTLIGQSSTDFPQTPSGMTGKKVKIPANILRMLINRSIFCVSPDELRPAMTGVLFKFSDSELKAVATDGHRLVRLRSTLSQGGVSQDIIVPAKALHLLAKSTDDGECVLTVDTKSVLFTVGTTTLTTRLIEETYPNYESVIPLDNDKTLEVNRDETLGAVRRVSLYSSSTTHQIRFAVTKKELTITAVDIDFGGEANETVGCTYDSADLEIGFNSRYIIDVLSHLDSEKVVFKLSNPIRAAIITPSGKSEDDIMMLVMPMRLNY